MRLQTLIVAATASALLCLATPSAEAGEVSTSFPFEIDKWYELEVTDGPVTLHRIRVKEDTGGITKARIFRPGRDNPYSTTVVIELEYSNDSSRDWDAKITAHWADAEGTPIDGYVGTESLDEEERLEATTMTLATLKYGIEKAKTFDVEIRFEPD